MKIKNKNLRNKIHLHVNFFFIKTKFGNGSGRVLPFPTASNPQNHPIPDPARDNTPKYI